MTYQEAVEECNKHKLARKTIQFKNGESFVVNRVEPAPENEEWFPYVFFDLDENNLLPYYRLDYVLRVGTIL